MNADTGQYEIEAVGPLDSEDNIETNAVASNTSNEAAYTSALTRADPNRMGQVYDVNEAGAKQRANAAISEQVGQQTSYLQGLGNL